MADNDWDSVTYLKKKPVSASVAKSEQAINQARRAGASIETEKKFAAGSNRQHATDKDTAKLDRETEELHHDRVTLDLARTIMKARNDLKMTQKDLATKINEKPGVINEYESGKAIPNQQILSKLERTLKVKLRGAAMGQPL
eukprot:Opistho-1_new@3300